MIPVLIGCGAFVYLNLCFAQEYYGFLKVIDSKKYPMPRWLPVSFALMIVFLPSIVWVDAVRGILFLIGLFLWGNQRFEAGLRKGQLKKRYDQLKMFR